MKLQTSHHGEIMIDHRNAPAAFGVEAGKLFEARTKKCCGCQRIIIMRPERERTRHYCRGCDSFMCDDCYLTFTVSGEHIPFNKVFNAAYEAALRGLKPVGVVRHGTRQNL